MNSNYQQHDDTAPPDSWCGTGVVLIADDDAAMRALNTRMLELLGFTPLLAVDGPAALDTFREHSADIVCSVLDISMPGMRGDEVAAAIREICPGAAIIVSSGYDEQQCIEALGGHGPAAFLRKPYGFQDLKKLMHRLVG